MKAIATIFVVAIVVYSCKDELAQAEAINLADVPLQTVENMFAVQTSNGRMEMRLEAAVMESYDKDTCSYDLFPKGLKVFAYTSEGLLETTITANNARHHKSKNTSKESWSVFGHVVIDNVIKQEVMETDTLYWDRTKQEIYTDCYVKMYSPDGFMQGYGMRSDERARNAEILIPFNSFGVVVQDTTSVLIDTANFIGPLRRN